MTDKVTGPSKVTAQGNPAPDDASTLYDAIWSAIDAHQLQCERDILNVTVLGVLEIVKQDILASARAAAL